MRYGLPMALLLVFNARGLLAQSDIRGDIDSCFAGSRGSVSVITDCIASRWSSMIEQAERNCADAKLAVSSCSERAKRCEDGQWAARIDFDKKRSELQSACAQQIDQAVLKERERGRPAVDTKALVALALSDEREKVRKDREAKRSQASAKLSTFFDKLLESSKIIAKDIEWWRRDGTAGLLVIRRKTENVVVLPFASIGKALLADNNTQLDLYCVGNDNKCVTLVENNLRMSFVTSVRLTVSATNAEALLESAQAALAAFPY